MESIVNDKAMSQVTNVINTQGCLDEINSDIVHEEDVFPDAGEDAVDDEIYQDTGGSPSHITNVQNTEDDAYVCMKGYFQALCDSVMTLKKEERGAAIVECKDVLNRYTARFRNDGTSTKSTNTSVSGQAMVSTNNINVTKKQQLSKKCYR
jgi:hypothetical protein